jgi:hypothetical protein
MWVLKYSGRSQRKSLTSVPRATDRDFPLVKNRAVRQSLMRVRIYARL